MLYQSPPESPATFVKGKVSSIPTLGVSDCHFRILTQRVTFETWDHSDIWSERQKDKITQKYKKIKRQKDKKDRNTKKEMTKTKKYEEIKRWKAKKMKQKVKQTGIFKYKNQKESDVRAVSHSCDVLKLPWGACSCTSCLRHMVDLEPMAGSQQADEILHVKLLSPHNCYLICVPVFPNPINLDVVIRNVSLSRENTILLMFFLWKIGLILKRLFRGQRLVPHH